MNSSKNQQRIIPTRTGDDRQGAVATSETTPEPQPLRLSRQRLPGKASRSYQGVAATEGGRGESRAAPAVSSQQATDESTDTARLPLGSGSLLLAGLLIVTVLFSVTLLPSIETALQLPAHSAASSQSTGQPSALGTGQRGTLSVSPGQQGATPTALPGGMSLLATDTFHRPDQRGWGAASDGHLWQSDARLSAIFSISHQQGQLVGGQGAYNAILGPAFSDGEVFFTGAINSFQQANLGAVLRWMDTNNWYKAYLDGSQLVLLKSSGGMQTRLAAVPFAAQANRPYHLRFRIQGDQLQARAWLAGTPEPTQWQVSARDDSFQSGFGGLRLVLAPATVITISAFQELALASSAAAARRSGHT
ncbi:hypothetical protein [Thermogemmatispora sp.]|uniref:hypothetical protein n=1 Tax=Thermogemmatispora sp. TaxID=1968838 RepID=UPI001D9A8D32|nr:hypothetical protein [Thermogemmatispora sp.]MBX5448624.1 hypothetical protein [Thermogemmatispora sp.]